MNPRFDDPLFLQRTLSEFTQGLAALAGAVWGPGGTGPATPEALQESLASGYQRLFAPAGFAAAQAELLMALVELRAVQA